MKKFDIYKELRSLMCSCLSGHIKSAFALGILCIVGSIVLLITSIKNIDVKTIIACTMIFLFGLWLLRSVSRDYKEEYRRETIPEEQRKKGLRD